MNIRPLPPIPPQKVPRNKLARQRDSKQEIYEKLEDVAQIDLSLFRRIAFWRPDLLAPRDLGLALLLAFYPRVVQLTLFFPIILVSSWCTAHGVPTDGCM